jgi:hypothetical protein
MLAAASALRFAGDFIAFFGALIATLGCMKQILLAHKQTNKNKNQGTSLCLLFRNFRSSILLN